MGDKLQDICSEIGMSAPATVMPWQTSVATCATISIFFIVFGIVIIALNKRG